ncbi:hypothetical protein HPP92_014095 [Vanilla planifolia]|uniref:Uncharacterized protein n=1 Tax=Vanilla planifolia TaxID=51239 RepID=A0A835QW29_VANPL|nr:hypothetical protein HPP92_014095 [Vanilla planifolia]
MARPSPTCRCQCSSCSPPGLCHRWPLSTACSVDKFSSPCKYNSNLHLLLSNLTGSGYPLPPTFSPQHPSAVPRLPTLWSRSVPPLMPLPDLCTECLSLASSTAPCQRVRRFAVTATQRLSDTNPATCATPIRNSSASSTGVWLYSLLALRIRQTRWFSEDIAEVNSRYLAQGLHFESRFAVGKRMIEEVQHTIYGLAWCSMDLIINDCLNCLSSVQDWL